jgi:(1->4)-alpha-D-glucan 1-alpha-D-glucosylmutase
MGTLDDGRAKLWVASRVLRFRRANPDLFAQGICIPLRALGERRSHVIAFARGFGAQLAIAVAGRYFSKTALAGQKMESANAWEGSELILPRGLAAGSYRDVFIGKVLLPEARQGRSVLPLAEIFSCCPVALLEKLPE